MRIGDDKRIGLEFGDLGMHAPKLGGRVLAGESCIVQDHRSERRRRPVAPDRVDQIGLDRHQRGAGRGACLGKLLGALDGVQPGVVTDTLPGSEILLDPLAGWRLDQMRNRKQRGIDLVAHLERVAAVNEKHRAIHQDDGRAGRPGESGQPGKALLAGGNVFVLLPVGAWHDQAGQSAARKFRA